MVVKRIVETENTSEFKEILAKKIESKQFELVLYRSKEEGNTIHAEEVDYIPIQNNACLLLEGVHSIGLGFKKELFLLRCVGKNRIEKLRSRKATIEKTLNEIESVLGKVPAVDKLRKNVENYQQAIRDVFDFNKEIQDEAV